MKPHEFKRLDCLAAARNEADLYFGAKNGLLRHGQIGALGGFLWPRHFTLRQGSTDAETIGIALTEPDKQLIGNKMTCPTDDIKYGKDTWHELFVLAVEDDEGAPFLGITLKTNAGGRLEICAKQRHDGRASFKALTDDEKQRLGFDLVDDQFRLTEKGKQQQRRAADHIKVERVQVRLQRIVSSATDEAGKENVLQLLTKLHRELDTLDPTGVAEDFANEIKRAQDAEETAWPLATQTSDSAFQPCKRFRL